MKTIVPPIKSQGIKTKLVPWIRALAGSKFDKWVEPFMGTGVVGFNMNPRNAVLGDSNPHLVSFYSAVQRGEINSIVVREYLEREGDLLRNAAEGGYVHYRLVRSRFNANPNPLDFLFLSRAGFNGMMRFSKKGGFNIPFCKKPNRFAQAYVTKIANQVDTVSKVIKPQWRFLHQDYAQTIAEAGANDLIYCDPPYLGRYTDYFNNWIEDDEMRLAQALSNTKARFILSTWHHNEFRKNIAINTYWKNFNIVTRDHFYHSGAKEENRRSIVEALICNFDCGELDGHNHGVVNKSVQLSLIDGLNM